jgi:glycosyltransferase involved in cell wall biosynthesis
MASGPAGGRSGIGDYVADLTSEMSATSVETVVLPMGRDVPVTFTRRAARLGLSEVDVIHVQHEYGLFGSFAAMSWLFFSVLYGLAAVRRKPVVVTIHEGLNERLVASPLKPVKRLYLAVLNRLIVLNAAHVVFLSENTAEEFTESVPLESYSVLPHGAHRDPHVDIEKPEARRRFGYDPEQTVVTQPGYVEPRKGSDRLVELARRLEDLEFLLAGGPATDEFEDYFDELAYQAPPNLTLTGFLEEEEFHTSFVASDLVVLSYQEPEQSGIVNTVNQSGILNRCATYGVPVVASDIQYFRRLNEQWDCLQTCDFADGDTAEETIRELLDDDEELEKLSRRMREYAETESFAEAAKRHERIYQNV